MELLSQLLCTSVRLHRAKKRGWSLSSIALSDPGLAVQAFPCFQTSQRLQGVSPASRSIQRGGNPGLGWSCLCVCPRGAQHSREGEEEEEGEGWAVPGAQLPSGSLIRAGTASRVTLGCKSH